MAKIYIDSAYQLKLTPEEASVLLALTAAAYVKANMERDPEIDNEAENMLCGIHDALVNVGIEEADVAFEITAD